MHRSRPAIEAVARREETEEGAGEEVACTCLRGRSRGESGGEEGGYSAGGRAVRPAGGGRGGEERPEPDAFSSVAPAPGAISKFRNGRHHRDVLHFISS